MPPPKNGSLGRGLGDLLGGVPESIGVAGVPQAPAEKPAAVVETPPPEPVAAPPCWKPSRVMLVFLSSLLLVLTGVVIGLRVVQLRAPQDPADESWGKSLPARVVVVTNTVVVRDEPARPATVDASLLQPLEASGITVVPESDGTVRLIFNAPVFSSRVVLDPDQTACLDQLGTLLATHSSEWEAKVVGHTDDVPFRGSGMVRDNRELGLARAVEVVRYLSRQTGIPASMLSAATAGEENPPFPGNDPESRLKNRTVTLVIRPLSK